MTMPRFTDEQVEAARMALPAFSFPTPSQMRAALTAAADAASAVDTDGIALQIVMYGQISATRRLASKLAGETMSDPDIHPMVMRINELLEDREDAARQRLLNMFKGAAR
jgi:hypothetical protein